MNHKANLTTSILAAIAAMAMLAGCSFQSSPTPGVAPGPVAHDPVVAYQQYKTSSQLAEGLYLAGSAKRAIDTYMSIRGKLPTSLGQAESVELRNSPKLATSGKYVGSVSVGPIPGEVTVMWTRGELSGKSLVLLPVLSDRLCFRVGTSTTVPDAVLAHANIADECQPGE